MIVVAPKVHRLPPRRGRQISRVRVRQQVHQARNRIRFLQLHRNKFYHRVVRIRLRSHTTSAGKSPLARTQASYNAPMLPANGESNASAKLDPERQFAPAS
jgi:hypothetical protein